MTPVLDKYRRATIDKVFTNPLLLLLLAVCVGGERTTYADENATTEVVEVEGAGVDVESARKDACRQAVRQVVGAYLGDKTVVENDELIEDKVIALSSGFVEKVEPIKERKADGLVRVKIRATVRKTKVIESLKKNKLSVAKVDGLSLEGQLDTTNDQRQGAADLIQAAFDGFPAKWFDVETEGKARLGERKDGEPVPLLVTLRIKPDLEAFVASATKLDEALKATQRPHGEFQVDNAKMKWVQDRAQAQAKAGERLRQMILDPNRREEQQCKVLAIDFFDDDGNFPPELLAYPGTHEFRPCIVDQNTIPVVFPVKFFADGKRSTWHWYGLKVDEVLRFVKPRRKKKVKCQTVLLNEKGQEIAVDSWEIGNLGIGGMDAFEDWQVADSSSSYRFSVALAPALLHRQNGGQGFDWIVSQFTCERPFLLESNEVRTVKQVKATLE